MPTGGSTVAKKEIERKPYTQTGQAARDSIRKRIYETFLEVMSADNDSNTYPIDTWTTRLEDWLYQQSGSQVTKECREKAVVLTKNIRVHCLREI